MKKIIIFLTLAVILCFVSCVNDSPVAVSRNFDLANGTTEEIEIPIDEDTTPAPTTEEITTTSEPSTEPPITTEEPMQALTTQAPTAAPTESTTQPPTTGLTGHHVITYDNGDQYEGNFVNGIRSGQGTYTWADGIIFIGEFVNGDPSDVGEYIHPTEAPTDPPTRVTQGRTVYWVANGEVYHSTSGCRSLARSTNIRSGTIAESGKSRGCRNCT